MTLLQFHKIFNISKTTGLISKLLILLESPEDVDIDRYIDYPIRTITKTINILHKYIFTKYSISQKLLAQLQNCWYRWEAQEI